MRFSREFRTHVMAVIFWSIHLQLVESFIPGVKDIAVALIDYGVKFVPKGSQDPLKYVLKSAAIGIGASFEQTVRESTDIMIRHFDGKIDGLEELLKNQSYVTLAELGGMKLASEHTKLDDMLQELNKFHEYYNLQFINCVEKKKCDDETRKKYSDYWLDPHSQDRSNLFDFVNKYIAHSSKYSAEERIFDLIPKIAMRNHMGRRPRWTHHESLQNTIYTFYVYVIGSLSRMYRVTLHFMTENYHNKSGTLNGLGSLGEISTLLQKYKADMEAIVMVAKEALISVSRDIYPDDPPIYLRRENYNLLRRFLVSYVKVNKPNEDMYKDFLETTFTRYQWNTYQASSFHECNKTFSHVPRIWINIIDDDRFYHHFEAAIGWNPLQIYGKQNDPVYDGYVTRIDMKARNHENFGTRYLRIRSDLCYLEYPPQDFLTVRNFSRSMARASRGHVVTGIRWKIFEGSIHLQIQEGLLVKGTIKPDTVKWKPIEENTEGYITLKFDRRSFNLDDIILPFGTFLTGAQFQLIEDSITLRAFARNVTVDGNLDHESLEIYSPNTKNQRDREEIKLDGLDISTNAPHDRQHKMQGSPGKSFIKFQVTDLKKDAGQTTIPFLDTQEVVTNPPAPLGGVGTYYKGMPGYGGFIGLKLISADILPLLNNEYIGDSFGEVEQMIVKEEKAINKN